MLCMYCAGTNYSVIPNDLLPAEPVGDEQDQACPECGQKQWDVCPNCLGLGCKLVRDGSCSSCGRTVSHWQRCPTCTGHGRIYLLKSAQAAAGCPHTPAFAASFKESHQAVGR